MPQEAEAATAIPPARKQHGAFKRAIGRVARLLPSHADSKQHHQKQPHDGKGATASAYAEAPPPTSAASQGCDWGQGRPAGQGLAEAGLPLMPSASCNTLAHARARRPSSSHYTTADHSALLLRCVRRIPTPRRCCSAASLEPSRGLSAQPAALSSDHPTPLSLLALAPCPQPA